MRLSLMLVPHEGTTHFMAIFLVYTLTLCSIPGVRCFFELHGRKQDPGTSFPRVFLKCMTYPSSTQVLGIPARSEQYALFLSPIISAIK